VSILLLKWVERRAYKRSLAEAAKPGGGVAGDSSAS
jgi:hypothetical protein